jgi:3-oxoacyl-[acyl-carrier-protein] synthase I
MAERAAEKVLIPALVTGTSARCPLGLSALQAAMLVRARRGEPRATRFLDKRRRFAGASTTPGLRGDLHGFDRLIALAAPALRAAVAGGAPSAAWPLLLAVPERGRPDDDARLDGAIVQALSEASGVAIDAARSGTVRAGHAGFALALAAALDDIGRGAPAVVVGAVDSYYHPDVLAWLDEEHRLHALDAENGFVPGEGAAFVVLTPALARPGRKEAPRESHVPPVLLRRVETGREDTVATGDPNIGRAMTAVLRDLAVSSPGGKLAWSLTDVNGERHRVREWELAAGRGAFADDAVHQRPTGELGDLGAASGGVMAAIACALLRAGAAPRPCVCVALASDGPERGAFLLSFEGAAR